MKKSLSHLQGFFLLALAFLFGLGIAGTFLTDEASAQIRPAYVRDVDTPALTPFKACVEASGSTLNNQTLLTTVPAGKRLVIEYISYWSSSGPSDQLVWGSLRVSQYGPYRVFLEIHQPHASADPSFMIQDGSQPVKVYFEAGEEVWVSASHNTNTYRDFNICVVGNLITP